MEQRKGGRKKKNREGKWQGGERWDWDRKGTKRVVYQHRGRKEKGGKTLMEGRGGGGGLRNYVWLQEILMGGQWVAILEVWLIMIV